MAIAYVFIFCYVFWPPLDQSVNAVCLIGWRHICGVLSSTTVYGGAPQIMVNRRCGVVEHEEVCMVRRIFMGDYWKWLFLFCAPYADELQVVAQSAKLYDQF